jgi:hypothetical protein
LRRTFQPDPQIWPRPGVAKDRCGTILGHAQIHAAIPIFIRQSTTALLSEYSHTGLTAAEGREIAVPIAAQPKAQSRVVTGCLRLDVEEILREEEIFVAIAIPVTHRDAESRRELGLDRKERASNSLAVRNTIESAIAWSHKRLN